jgi:uncharacterized protein (TIGR00730 family)
VKRLCVFCGSNPGRDPVYREAAVALGRLLAESGLGLVYGGGSVGLMGALADAVLAAGGEAVGVIPEALATKEVAHAGLTDLRVVPSMHARKSLMVDLADAFVALPGGYGTLDELFETITWAQLGIHRKPIGLLDAAGYFAPLVAFLDHAVAEGFISKANRELFLVSPSPEALLDALRRHQPPRLPKWLRPDET